MSYTNRNSAHGTLKDINSNLEDLLTLVKGDNAKDFEKEIESGILNATNIGELIESFIRAHLNVDKTIKRASSNSSFTIEDIKKTKMPIKMYFNTIIQPSVTLDFSVKDLQFRLTYNYDREKKKFKQDFAYIDFINSGISKTIKNYIQGDKREDGSFKRKPATWQSQVAKKYTVAFDYVEALLEQMNFDVLLMQHILMNLEKTSFECDDIRNVTPALVQ